MMPTTTSPTRDAAHVLLDLMVTFDPETSEEVNATALKTAFQRMGEIDAVVLTHDDDTDEMHLDITPLLTATGYLMNLLLTYIAEKAGQEPIAVAALLREMVDANIE
jgi:hypothetical protein